MSEVVLWAQGSEHEDVPDNISRKSGLGSLPLGADLAGRAVTPSYHTQFSVTLLPPFVCRHFPTSNGTHFTTGQKKRPDPVLWGFKPSLKHVLNGLAEGFSSGMNTASSQPPSSLEWPCDPLLSSEM